MSRIILDISANTHQNNFDYFKRMIDELKFIDTGKHEIIIKHQLFKHEENNIPLDHIMFYNAYIYARKVGYKTASSVFDKYSLDFLLNYDVPFIKIANRRDLDWLIGEIPRKIPVYVSISSFDEWTYIYSKYSNLKTLGCYSKYPSYIEDYKFLEERELFKYTGISDHTTNWDLYNKYKPEIYECHFVLERSESNPDGGAFARTISDLKEIL